MSFRARQGRTEKPPGVPYEAVVLRVTPYGDTDLVVHLLVRGIGRVGTFARGARSSKKRYSGGIEPFCSLSAELVERRGSDLWELRGSTVTASYRSLRENLSRLAQAGYATELVRELVRDHVPHDDLFDLLTRFLERLSATEPTSLRLRALELAVLHAVGLAPALGDCVRCATACQDMFFDMGQGGAACAACTRPGATPVSSVAWRLLRVLAAGGLDAGEADESHLPVDEVRRVLSAFIDRQLTSPLRSREFLAQVGAPA